MPIIDPSAKIQTNPRQLSFLERLKSGRVVPIISGAAIADLTIGGHAQLTNRLSAYLDYRLPDKDRLVEIARFWKVQSKLHDEDLKAEFLNFVKNFLLWTAQDEGLDEDTLAGAIEQLDKTAVTEFAGLLGYPRFTDSPDDLLLQLANLPIKVYLTTTPYRIIEQALERAGKEPLIEICRWKESLDGIPPSITPHYQPSPQQPLVYHLHGLDRYPDSLVLTEDDHLRFLVNISQGAGNASADRVHGIVRQALFDDLIMLGFHLSDWGFRSLYAGLINAISRPDDRGVCVLQVTDNEVEKQYFEEYLEHEAQFEVFWGKVSEYGPELQRLLSS